MAFVADGTEAAARRLECVLFKYPAIGVDRHADAGYEDAVSCAREQGLRVQILDSQAPDGLPIRTRRQADSHP